MYCVAQSTVNVARRSHFAVGMDNVRQSVQERTAVTALDALILKSVARVTVRLRGLQPIHVTVL